MQDLLLTLELILRGIAIGALVANGASFCRAGVRNTMRVAALLFFSSIIAYSINSSMHLRTSFGWYLAPATLLSLGGGGYFWLFVVTLFQDRPISVQRLAPAALLTALGLWGLYSEDPIRSAVWVTHNLVEIGLSLSALYIIHDSWREDLVDARRHLRGPFLGIVTVYTIAMSGIEIGESFGIEASWYGLAGAGMLALFCLAGCIMFLRIEPHIFGAATRENVPSDAAVDPLDRAALDRLAKTMDGGAWKDEHLTIGSLAQTVGVPEHRLRRLVNDHLGFRNFAAFVNSRRIEAAKQRLGDPAQTRTTVAAIAYDLGFGSIGPFNRAFKDATGKTPTQWRRDALTESLPKPEKAG